MSRAEKIHPWDAQKSLGFKYDFHKYTSGQREKLAQSVRGKSSEQFTPEEKAFVEWSNSFRKDDQPQTADYTGRTK